MKASDIKTKMKTGSNIKDKFRSQKQDLMKRHQEQVDNKDQGNDYPTIFNKTAIPKGIGFWKCGKGEHVLDIIPFFAGKQHPRVKEGELSYVIDLWVHNNVGPLRTPYVCTAKNFKENDPICEYIAKNRLDKEEWKRTASKRRTVYLVWVHDTPEEEKKGIQIWEVAHFFFESHIDEIAKSPRGGGATAFSDIESGKSIAFTVKSTGKYKDGDVERDSIGYSGHRFIDRDIDVIPDKILEQSFSLDECIVMHPDYDEVDEAFNGSSKATRNKYQEESDEPEPEEEVQEEQESSFDPEDELPSKEQKVKKGSKKPEPEPEEEEAVEEEMECPHDPDSFGEVDEHPECEEDGGCPIWDACSDEANRRKKEAEKAKAKKKLGKK
jgi:hypothetical protein